ncbi:hypothetical protein AAKU58_000237 [Oxalobacteraceae bacterium GrIS 1.18]
MDKTTFQQFSQAAILEAKSTRLTLIRNQAENFINGDAQFDPKILHRLGSAGIAIFLKQVRESGVVVHHTPVSDRATKTESPSPHLIKPPGWGHQRRAEPVWIVRAIAFGFASGLGLIITGTVGFFLFNY